MATVFKRNILKPIPTGAAIIERSGKRIAKFTEGTRTVTRPIVSTRSGDRIVTGQSSVWMGKVKVGPDHRKVVRLYTDKTSSERRLAELQKLADRRASGVRTVEMDHAETSVARHVADYKAAKSLEKQTTNHQRIASWMLDKLVEWGNWQRLSDITPDSMRTILARLDKQGKTPSYLNKFIIRSKAFVHWMEEEGRIVGDPLRSLKRADEVRGKKTRERRPLDENEIRALLDTAPESRRLKYALPILAGIRREEFNDLLWGDLRMNAPRPFIKLRPEQTKNSKTDVLPLHPWLVAEIRKLTPGDPDRPVITSVPDMKTMAKDLFRAGIATKTAEGKISIADAKGRRADYHALRHTYSNNLDATGCSYVTKQCLLRHTIKGVTGGYTYARIEELYAAVERLPWPDSNAPVVAPQVDAAVKTGTTDDVDHAHQPAHQNPVADGRTLSSTDERDSAADEACRDAQPAYDSEVGDNCLALAEMVVDSAHNPSIDNDLRPSTQVD